jgi:uncharacterized protein YndB with AHSA1/START domain
VSPGKQTAAYEVTAEIHAPVERVWESLSAVESWPQWVPTVVKVEAFDGTTLKPGARFRLTQPKLRPVVWTVSELEAPVRFAWRAKSPGMELVADHVLEGTAAGATRVHLYFEFKGWLGGLLRAAYGAITQDYMAQEAQALKVRAEAASRERSLASPSS